MNPLVLLVKKVLQGVGIDITRTARKPQHTLLGIRHLPILSIIDVGANQGQFAKRMTAVFPKAQIFSFEPLPEPFTSLKKWAEQRTDNQVVAFNVALGDQEGTIEMLLHSEHSPSSSILRTTKLCNELYPFTSQQVSVPVHLRTLDKFLTEQSLLLVPDILIKLDVQGYEDRVIRGGQETFEKAIACIVEVNLDSLYEGQADFERILQSLGELDYRYAGNLEQRYAKDGHVIFIDALFVHGVQMTSISSVT